MGTDIHTYVEKRNKDTGKWQYSPLFLYNHDPDLSYIFIAPYCWRSYPLFGILADVRYSFEHSPISEPKGIPNDLSAEIQRIYDENSDYIHTPSYYTLKELSNYYYKHKKTINSSDIHYMITNVDGEPIPINGMTAYLTPCLFDPEEEDFQHGLEALRTIIAYMSFIQDTDYNLTGDDIRLIFWFDS